MTDWLICIGHLFINRPQKVKVMSNELGRGVYSKGARENIHKRHLFNLSLFSRVSGSFLFCRS
jgi:hypothetical protein